MRATEFIRNILDLIDRVDTEQSKPAVTGKEAMPPESGETTQNRFKSIYAMLSSRNQPKQYSNSPNEVVTDIDSVTVDAGGAAHRPEDVRGEHPRLYGDN
jgi:hypothetical protein